MMVIEEEQLREGVRAQLDALSERLECGGDVEKQQFHKSRLVHKLSQAPLAVLTEKANEQHYEVDTDFFKLVLDKRLKYSCGLWTDDACDLETAQEAMLKLICDRAQLQNGHYVMDLGCGWGALGLYICSRYPACRVLCLSNSNTQRTHIEREAARLGFTTNGRLRVVTADAKYYDNPAHRRAFNRIISIEMFEHMRNYSGLLCRVSGWLAPEGKLFTQILCHSRSPYLFNTTRGSDTDWMANNFFTGGTMPSADLFLYFQRDVVVEDMWLINGGHYARTLDAWLARMNAQATRVERVFARTAPGHSATEVLAPGHSATEVLAPGHSTTEVLAPGHSTTEEHVRRHMFNWRMFFIMCSEVFAYGGGNKWVVAHHLFTPRHCTASQPAAAKAKL